MVKQELRKFFKCFLTIFFYKSNSNRSASFKKRTNIRVRSSKRRNFFIRMMAKIIAFRARISKKRNFNSNFFSLQIPIINCVLEIVRKFFFIISVNVHVIINIFRTIKINFLSVSAKENRFSKILFKIQPCRRRINPHFSITRSSFNFCGKIKLNYIIISLINQTATRSAKMNIKTPIFESAALIFFKNIFIYRIRLLKIVAEKIVIVNQFIKNMGIMLENLFHAIASFPFPYINIITQFIKKVKKKRVGFPTRKLRLNLKISIITLHLTYIRGQCSHSVKGNSPCYPCGLDYCRRPHDLIFHFNSQVPSLPNPQTKYNLIS